MMATPRHLAGRWIGAALALAASVLLAPSTARASCGDYVVMDHSSGHAAPMSAGEMPDPVKHPAPCHGPGCSQAPPLNPLTAVPPLPTGGTEWGCPVAVTPCAPSPFLTHLPREEAVRPIRRILAIYHPPR